MKRRLRIALVVEDIALLATARLSLAEFEVITIARGRHLAADLAAAKPDLLILESVHPSEAGWLMGWLQAQSKLVRLPTIIIVPFGPLPAPDRAGLSILESPLSDDQLSAAIERVLDPGDTVRR